MGKPPLFVTIAFNYHDSSIAIGEGNKVKLILEAERIFKKKKMSCDSKEMEKLIKIGLEYLSKTEEDVDYWGMETLKNPFLKKADKISSPPTWKKVGFLGEKRNVLIINHHLAHASAFLYSAFDNATILTCDGGGDCGERVSAYVGNKNSLEKLSLDVGNFISAKPYDLCATYLYGYPRAEGKMMALAAFGTPNQEFINKIEENIQIMCTTNYEKGEKLFKKLFPDLTGKTINSPSACDLAASLQYVFVHHRSKDIKKVLNFKPSTNVVLSGGACLNLESNTKIWEEIKQPLFIPSCCDDTGSSLGVLAYLMTEVNNKRPEVSLPYLGQGKENYNLDERSITLTAKALLNGEIILVHNSQAEIGPRALGNRSFFARPDSEKVKKNLSEGVKMRESYRPVAPIVLEEEVGNYFKGPKSSPFMLHQYNVLGGQADLVCGAYHQDGTSRVQTITAQSNPFAYELIQRFAELSGGAPVLLNTSLNLKGDPIANDIQDTLKISNKINIPHRIIYDGVMIK